MARVIVLGNADLVDKSLIHFDGINVVATIDQNEPFSTKFFILESRHFPNELDGKLVRMNFYTKIPAGNRVEYSYSLEAIDANKSQTDSIILEALHPISSFFNSGKPKGEKL